MRRRGTISLPAAVLAAVLLAASASADPRYRIAVDGLTCPFCAYAIEKSLHALPAVTGLTTHVADGVVEIEVAEGETLSRDEVAAAVDRAGFDLAGFAEIEAGARDEDP